ncbi:response regulator [Dinghuibacter silviterrae]|uniref:LuxR family two component transcriptional regulator n=1 Tax=Dinghuibacter silviterrae TaxID=1539049 RepID=A0A4R8DII7_9BACT|nr:response regulator transcription factor [Dinghuibacter silviterrae]TDW97377.1 LuxR family two component transcriptional regulator [Dinghuibacter silviterrae]
MQVHLLVYEDNPDFRDALVQMINLTAEYRCDGAFEQCGRVEEDLKTYAPDVVLMDIDLPGTGGIEGVRRIRAVNASVKIIMLTVFDTNRHVLDAICAGASGYILKPQAFRKLFEAIDEVLSGGAPMSASVARMVLEHTRKGLQTPSDGFSLSAKEQEVLGYLVRGNSFKMIASETGTSFETVKTHVKNIYEKLQVHSKSEAVAKALRNRLFD